MTGKTPIQMGSMVYFCIAKGTRILHSYNGGDAKLGALALRCLERTPPFHVWYFHTVGEKTYGFLMDDGFTYFAISDPSIENFEALRFLEHLRDGFKKVVKKGLKEESTAVIHRLITLLQSSRYPILSANQMPEGSSLETVDGASLRKSSSMRVHHSQQQQQQARKLWRHHVKTTLAIDALVLVLFGIWLAVCAGFQCIS